MQRLRAVLIAILLLGAFGASVFLERDRIRDFWYEQGKEELPVPVSYQALQEQAEKTLVPSQTDSENPPSVPPLKTEIPSTPVADEPVKEPSVPDNASEALPASINLAVPFTSQAPFSNWDEIHEETCEEAALFMVHAYYEGTPEGTIDPTTADEQLLQLVDFENAFFGYYKDTTAEQTGLLAQNVYGYEHVTVIDHPTIEQLKTELAAGHPVIIGAAGRELHNPYFTAPGPIYHMVVLRGYTSSGFITNDPGTRHGEGYVYSYTVLMNALHDWTGSETILDGIPRALIIRPN